ncbi:MAG TPA: NUDIX domain-containing protein [Candidatus Atribacteria bacterium]|nr:NUDIX domain-containing protein [Candidatus Atribacteria bacterium]
MVYKRRRGTVIIDTERGILVVRDKGKRVFTLPGGSTKKGESRKAAAIRELREETGLVAEEVKYLFSLIGPKHRSYKGGFYRDHHKVFLIKTHGEAKPRKEISEIRYYKEGDEIPLSRTTKRIIEKYLKFKKSSKTKKIFLLLKEKFMFWFNYKKHPRSKLRIKNLVKDALYLLILLIFAFMIYENITQLNKIVIVFLKLGSLLLLGSCLLSVKYIYRILINLKYGFRGLKNGYKLIAIILLVALVFYGYQNHETYFSKIDNSINSLNYAYFNPVIINSSEISNFWEHEILGYPTKEELETNPKNITLKYVLRGETNHIRFTVYGGVNEYLRNLPRSISYYEGEPEPTTKDFVMKYLNDEIQRDYLIGLVEKIKEETNNKDDQARIAISLVQQIPYDWEGFKSGNLKGRYPYEVIYDNKGVCGEKSRLLAFLLRELGFDVIIFKFELENHMAVGIKCPAQYSYKNTGYCFIETARPTIITDYQEEYVGVGKLTSTPEIIHISGGISFNSVSEEYKDAQEWIRINKLSESSGGYLDQYNYDRWLSLVNKYGIEISR